MRRVYILLGLVVAFFLFTRLYKISQIPASLYWDEASIGYNAYSLLQDGKDEWGNFLPLHFRAFGEFKLPVYVYSVAASEFLFGPGIFSVRFPSVVFSLISLVLVYLIATKIFNRNTGLFSALIFSISPWNFIFSRSGYEASAGLMFFLLGAYLFLGSDKKPFIFLPTVISFILSFYSYNSFRLLAPFFLLIFGLVFVLRKGVMIKSKLLYIFAGGFLFLLSIVPVYRLYKFDAGASRLTQVQESGKLSVVENYFSHFSYPFLFVDGDSNPRSNIPGNGEIYLVYLPFLIIGAAYLFSKRNKFWWLPVLAILAGPIPAAITKESPHALRSILTFPFLAMIAGLGMSYLIDIFKKNKELLALGIVLISLFSFENYYAKFLKEYPTKYANDWQYGYLEMFTNYSLAFDKYDKIVFSDAYAQPYIFALFYQRYNPESFRQTVTRNSVDKWGFSTVKSFGKFVFKKVEPTDLSTGSLVFASRNDLINKAEVSDEIKNPDGETVFWVYSK